MTATPTGSLPDLLRANSESNSVSVPIHIGNGASLRHAGVAFSERVVGGERRERRVVPRAGRERLQGLRERDAAEEARVHRGAREESVRPVGPRGRVDRL